MYMDMTLCNIFLHVCSGTCIISKIPVLVFSTFRQDLHLPVTYNCPLYVAGIILVKWLGQKSLIQKVNRLNNSNSISNSSTVEEILHFPKKIFS